MNRFLAVVAFVFLAPFLGGFLNGLDRKITARMQGRQGPPLLQPFYDVSKLFKKEPIGVNGVQSMFVMGFGFFAIFTGSIFFSGGDLLMTIFALTLSSIFLILAAFSANSAYSSIGAERELLQTMSYEPMLLLVPIGVYMATKLSMGTSATFAIADLFTASKPVVVYIPLILIGYLYILTIKLRKSPFDLSTSHHGHQEIVKGITTELSGRLLAITEITHWYETVIFLGFIVIFFVCASVWGLIIGIFVSLIAYFLEILIDNTFARAKWQIVLKYSWVVAAFLGILNLCILYFMKG